MSLQRCKTTLLDFGKLSDDDKYLFLEKSIENEKIITTLLQEIEDLKDALRSTSTLLRLDHPDFETIANRIQNILK